MDIEYVFRDWAIEIYELGIFNVDASLIARGEVTTDTGPMEVIYERLKEEQEEEEDED